MEALKAPFAMLDRILSALDGVWPALKKFLEVVNKSDSTLLGLKEAMCKAQEKFFGGLKTVCDRIDSVVALVGGKIDMLITLMADVGAKVNCKEATQAINKRVDEIVKRLAQPLSRRSTLRICTIFSSQTTILN